jgi:hypothetical protein
MTPPRGYPLDRLSLPKRGGPPSHPEAAVTIPGVDLLGFDELAIVQFTTRTEQVGNVSRYGPSPVFTVATGNTAAVITGVAVQMEPDSFCFRWGWFFQITRGPVQEFDIRTSLAADQDFGRTYAGRIWAPFASLDEVQIIRIRVDPGATLQIVAAVGLPVVTQPLNLYVRLIGYYEARK